jgi:hypothetical protein
MRDVLSEPSHRVANWLFILLNVAAVLQLTLGVVFTTMFLTATESAAFASFTRGITATALFFGSLVLALLLMSAAQLLRYVAAMSEQNP